MYNIIIFSLVSIGIGILFALPGISLGIILKKYQIAPNRLWGVLMLSIIFVFIKRIWFTDLSYNWFSFILILGTTVGVYRMDIYWALNKES